MVYERPELDVVGTATELIQAFAGPFDDGGGYAFSLGWAAHTAIED
jgi:hypothetical protein